MPDSVMGSTKVFGTFCLGSNPSPAVVVNKREKGYK